VLLERRTSCSQSFYEALSVKPDFYVNPSKISLIFSEKKGKKKLFLADNSRIRVAFFPNSFFKKELFKINLTIEDNKNRQKMTNKTF
jgi:hypothetical protein